MSNSKVFRSAQNRSAGLGSPKDGYLGFSSTIKAIQKTQIKKCEPYNLLREVAKKIRCPISRMYTKILFSNIHGQMKFMVSVGKNKDQATAGRTFMVVANVLRNDISAVVPINRKTNEEAITEKNKKSSKTSGANVPGTRSSRRSIRYRKRFRKLNRRSRLRRARRRPVRDQFAIKNFHDTGGTPPESFNDPKSSVKPKDFAAIFEDSNNRLYDENSLNDIQVDNPPGVAKFIGLGVNIDRPSVIASTELSPIIYDDTLDVYDQLILDRKFRLETVYRNLENVETEDIEGLLETMQEFRLLTEDAINSTAVIALLDDQLVNDISVDMFDIASVLGFNTSVQNSQLYCQILFDLGNYSLTGTYDTENGTRQLSATDGEINIDENYNSNFFTGKNPYSTGYVRKSSLSRNPLYASSYSFGNTGTYLGFYDSIDSTYIRNAGGSSNAGNAFINISTSEDAWINDLQTVFFELMMSRLISVGDTNAALLKNENYKNLAQAFLGDFRDPRAKLNDIKVPSQLASIIKFNSAGVNYYPLEQHLPSAGNLSGRTFLDAIVQPAIGSLIEETDPNFDLLNVWSESSTSSLEQFFQYVDAACIHGGAGIMINEIILSLIKCVADPDLKIGTKKHRHSNSMQLANSDLTSENIANIFHHGAKYFALYDNSSLGHLYNTFGYTFFKGQGALVEKLGQTSSTGLGIGPSIQQRVISYGINTGSQWNANQTRSIGDGNTVSEILNNAYEEFTRLFTLIENNVMTSIDILLADAGLISLSETPNYNISSVESYFENIPASVQSPSRLPTGVSPGTYEASLFSSMPRFYIRTLIARAIYQVVSKTNFLLSEEDLVKAAKVAVENTDPEQGPVRWKMTHGTWPLESGEAGLSADLYTALIPEEVQDALEGNVDVDVETDSDGNVESVNVSDPSEGWDFVDAIEGFCPLTLILEGEDNSTDNISLVRGNRALFDNFYDLLMTDRSRLHKMKQYLMKPITAYTNFPVTLEEAVGNISLESLSALAPIPGVDGQTLVKFTSENQISNMKKSFKIESPSETLRYLPNKHAVSDTEFRVARAFVDDYMQKNFSDEEKCLVQTIGIPTGLLASLKLSREKFSLTRDAEFMFFPSHVWTNKTNLFHPSVYLIPGSLSNCDENSSFNMMVENARYFVCDNTVSQMMSFSESRDYLGLSDDDAVKVFTNHALDYCLTLALKLTTGMEMSEDTFRIDPSTTRLFVSGDGQKNIETLLSTVPDGFDSVFSENGIDKPKQLVSKLVDSSLSEINTYIASLESRIITPEEICKKSLSSRIFDRVFCIFVHPDEHFTDRDSSGLKRITTVVEGETKTVYQIDLKETSGNSIRNDHFASYYYKVETK